MLNDEQILLKTANLLENMNISDKNTGKLLREISEDELTHIQRAIDEMDGEDLAFNEAFDGKMRLVIDFPTLDTGSDLGKFVDVFRDQEYEVDWDKGIVSGDKELQTADPAAVLAALTGPGPVIKPKKRKIQMKIGKFFAKIADLASKRDALGQKALDFLKNNRNKLNLKFGENVPTHVLNLTGTMIEFALNEEEQKRYEQLSDQLDMYLVKPGHLPADLNAWATRMAKYWQTNAGYIKKEIKTLKNDKYSIIITRDPIDILRMSDFDDITSCHSPPSREGGGSYYKCVVAEAHGHGAVAYVVETEDLLHATNTGNIQSAEQEIQKGEIFADTNRYGTEGDITPLSRLRLRQVRYYPEDDVLNAQMGVGIELSVPETTTYGKKIPGLADRITKWAKEAQKEQMASISADGAADDEHVYLKRFIKFGGSYGDNSIETLISKLFGLEHVGTAIQDTRTQDELDVNLVGSLMERYSNECAAIANRWNNHYTNCDVEYNIQGGDGEEVVILCTAEMDLKWDIDDWAKVPRYDYDIDSVLSELRDIGWNFVQESDAFLRKPTIRGPDDPNAKIVKLTFKIDSEGTSHVWLYGENQEIKFVGDFLSGDYALNPDGFDEFCVEINKIDDMRDALQERLTEYFKREGLIKTSELFKIGIDVQNGELGGNFSEWDVEGDEDFQYEDRDPDWISARLTIDLEPDNYGIGHEAVNPVILQKILGSRDFHTEMRRQIHKMGTLESQYVNSSVSHEATNVDNPDYYIKFQLELNSNSSDRQVQAFRDIVEEVEDEDEIRDMVGKILKYMVNSYQSSHMQQNLDENKKYDAQWAVNRWKMNL